MVNKGFTLIEVMIVVTIIAILAAIAAPSYSNYKIRVNRADTQAEMLSIAQDLSKYKGFNGSFKNATVVKIYGSAQSPQTQPQYDLTLSELTETSWILIAKPISTGQQKNNGWLCLNYKGERFWEKGVNACDKLSAVSDWDGR